MVPIEDADEGTDRWAVEQGWISLTPLRLDPTDDAQLEDARAAWPLDDAMAMALSPGTSSPEAAQIGARRRGRGVAHEERRHGR